MLEEALAALAAAGGTAVVQAAGTDVWAGLRQALARWVGRGHAQRERTELERLDQTAGELEAAEVAVAERVRVRQEAAWQARIEALLESLDDTERTRAAEELRALLAQYTAQGGVSAGPGGLAVGGNVDIHAEQGSIAAGLLHGGAHISPPSGAGSVPGLNGPATPSPAAPPAGTVIPKTVTVHADRNSVAIGRADQIVYHATPEEPTAWPHQVGVLPSQAQSFQHRAEAQPLRVAVDGGGTAVLGQVLTGMGGVGKTQLAADYARSAWHDGSLDVLVWVTASTRSAVVSGYAQAGVELCHARLDDPEQAARTFLAWLTPKAGARACRWLIVLDDVADPDDLHGLWPPASPYGRTLVTTRRRDAALIREGRRLVEVGLFTEAEAVTYLITFLAAHGRDEPADQLTALAHDLGHLPLALSQAAAYLIDSGQDVAAYRELLADRTTALAETTPDRLPDEQANPLTAAWSLSIDRADRLRPVGLARPMLQLAAMLDPNGISASVLTSPPALAYLAATHTREPPEAVGTAVGEAEAVGALRALHRLSLIDHTPGTPHQAVRVHQLIQRTVRETLMSGQHQRISLIAADALTAVWPEVERDTALAQVLRSNTEILRSHAGSFLWRPDVHPILVRAGQSLGESGQTAAAVAYFDRLADTFCHQLGADNAQTLSALRHLAWWQGEAGDPVGAAAALARLVPDQERVVGPDHPQAFTTRSSLGYWRGQAGDAAGAAATFAGLMHDQEQALGSQHSHTLTTRHALAHWRARAGDAVGAARELAELLPHQERVLGPDHPETLLTRHDLAHWRGKAAGDAVGAARELAELLSHHERVLGPHHPRTLQTRSNLANWKGEAGDVPGAISALTELLADRERIMGTDHPRTLFTRSDLARWRACTQEPATAVDTLFEVLGQMQRVLGPDHPRTLVTRGRLACSQGDAGHVDCAVVELAELLTDQQRVLGPHHPDTITTQGDLVHWRARQE